MLVGGFFFFFFLRLPHGHHVTPKEQVGGGGGRLKGTSGEIIISCNIISAFPFNNNDNKYISNGPNPSMIHV